MLTDTRPIYRSRCVGQHIGRDIGRYVSWHVDRQISIDTSAESQSICRPTYPSSIGWYIDRYVGPHVDRHIGRGVCKLHMVGIQRLTYFNKRCWNLGKCFCSTCGAINIYYWPSARPRWLDIGQVLFLCFYGLRQSATSFPGSLISPPFAI